MSDRLLTARELAGRFAVSTETILRWTRRGELPALRLPGGVIRYRPAAVDEWLEAHATGTAGDEELSTTRADRAHAGGYALLQSPMSTTRPLETARTEEGHDAG